jgi:hypothetical protein
MFLELAAGAYLLGDFIYHRLKGDETKSNPLEKPQIPRVDEGATIPLIFGRCRVRAPVLAHVRNVQSGFLNPGVPGVPADTILYGMDMLFVVGVGFEGAGDAHKNHLHSIWFGEKKLNMLAPETFDGDGGLGQQILAETGFLGGDAGFVGGQIEFLNHVRRSSASIPRWSTTRRSRPARDARRRGARICSRAINDTQDAARTIARSFAQIDATMYEDPRTGTLKLKLIRPTTSTVVPNINPSNCLELQGYTNGGWRDTVNKVRVIFRTGSTTYKEDSSPGHNLANAVGQGGASERESSFAFQVSCNPEGSRAKIEARELNVRSRPMAKCRAIVDRSFWDTVPGDAVSITWPEYNLNKVAFRVATSTAARCATTRSPSTSSRTSSA